MKKMLFVFNPHTGGGRLKNKLMDILCLFSGAGYKITVWPTQGQGHARDITRQNAPGQDLVVCCGGDGTLNEVVDGMLGLDPMPLLGYIPGGTTCDFASSLMLPKNNMMAAAERILHPKKVFQTDVGDLNGRAFNYVAAFGAFTDVSYTTPQKFKNALGYFAYLVEAVQRLPRLHPYHVKLDCDSGVFEDDYLVGMVANSTSVAGMKFRGTEKVRLDDGMFEVILVRQPHNIADLTELSSTLLSGKMDSPLLTILRIREGELITEDTPMAWTLDGEFGGSLSSAHIKVHHRALSICI